MGFKTFIDYVTGAAGYTRPRVFDFLDGSHAPVSINRPPLAFTKVSGSPFALTSAWKKVATITANERGLRIAPLASATVYDVEWCSYPAGTYATDNLVPDANGEPILGGEDFPAGVPIGDIYLKSASSQTAIVKTGV